MIPLHTKSQETPQEYCRIEDEIQCSSWNNGTRWAVLVESISFVSARKLQRFESGYVIFLSMGTGINCTHVVLKSCLKSSFPRYS